MPPLGRNAARRRGMRQHLALVDQRRRHNLRNHESRRKPRIGRQKGRQPLVDVRIQQPVDAPLRDAGQIGQHNGRVVEGIGQRRAMKIAARDAPLRCFAFRMSSPETPADYPSPIPPRSPAPRARAPAHRAPPHAPAACSAGNRRPARASRAPGAPRESPSRPATAAGAPPQRNLPGMRPGLVNARDRRPPGVPISASRRHGAGQIGQLRHAPRRAPRPVPPTAVMAWVPFSSARPFLGCQSDGLQPGAPQRLAARHPLALVEGLALADDHQRQVSQRSQIAAGAHRPFFRNHRMHAGDSAAPPAAPPAPGGSR